MSKIYTSLWTGETHTGKTYGYLDMFRNECMDGKKMLILATDTVSNITENIDLDEFKEFEDRIIMRKEDGYAIQITQSPKFAEASVVWALNEKKKDPSIGCIVVDNYDNLEEMYIADYKKKRNIEKMMPYDYGHPRSMVYLKFLKPFLNLPNTHFIVTSDIKEIYFNDKPTGRMDAIIPVNRRKHFSEWIWIERRNPATPKESIYGMVRKWKGLRTSLVIDDKTKFTDILEAVKIR